MSLCLQVQQYIWVCYIEGCIPRSGESRPHQYTKTPPIRPSNALEALNFDLQTSAGDQKSSTSPAHHRASAFPHNTSTCRLRYPRAPRSMAHYHQRANPCLLAIRLYKCVTNYRYGVHANHLQPVTPLEDAHNGRLERSPRWCGTIAYPACSCQQSGNEGE